MNDPRWHNVQDALWQVQTLAARQLRLGYRPAWSIGNMEPENYQENWKLIRDVADLARMILDRGASSPVSTGESGATESGV